MNKELIKKYKKEFEWWLNGGNILIKRNNDEWKLEYPYWSGDNIKYIIDDEYVEFRKALVEGSTIQYNPQTITHDRWDDLTLSANDEFGCKLSHYRIKPEEPEFKAGDWITFGLSEDTLEQVVRIDADGFPEISENSSRIEDAELWKPQLNEWCLFYEPKNLSCYYLMQSSGNGTSSKNGHNWTCCEPFIGTLPGVIHD